MNITERKQNTIEHLRGLAEGTVGVKCYQGICRNLFLCCKISSRFVVSYCSEWKEFSGNTEYPVPSPCGAEQAYTDIYDLWEGEYGASRKRLCLYLAEVLEKMTDEEFEEYCL